MKFHLAKIDKLSIFVQIILISGIAASFLDLGLISALFSLIMPVIFILSCLITLWLIIFKKSYYSFIGFFLFLISFNFFYQFSPTNIEITTSPISLLSYNVRAYHHPLINKENTDVSGGIAKFVDSISPDILLLQESDYKKGRNIKDYPYHFLGYRKGVNKSLLEIYSKYLILGKGYVDFHDTYNNAIYADIKVNEDTLRIYNVHLQSYVFNRSIAVNNYDELNFWVDLNKVISTQIAQATLVKNHALKSKKKFIISGDFNATMYSTPYRIMKKGMFDSFVSDGNGLGKTFSILNYPLRLDYFLYVKQIKVLSHDNFTLNLSDHEPIFVQFKIND